MGERVVRAGRIAGVAMLAATMLQARWGESAPVETPLAGSDGGADAAVWVRRVQRLSLDVRGRRLDATEHAELGRRLEGDPSGARAIYESYVDRWSTIDLYRRVAQPTESAPPTTMRNLFVGTLSKHVNAKSKVTTYYLPERSNEAHGEAPCPEASRRDVRPWWSPQATVKVCASSYKPETTFDAIGYCAGQPEPSLPTAARAGCGCGPLLLGCLPPHEEGALEERLDEAVRAEYVETIADLLVRGRPYDGWLTTSVTWQTGLTEGWYARREMLAELFEAGSATKTIEDRWARRFAAIDLSHPGRWIERKGVYAGAGVLVSTPLAEATYPTYRAQMKTLLESALCVPFKGIDVDSDSLLAAVSSRQADLRSLKVHESPMRDQAGCSGCHAPLDHGGAFLIGLRTPLFGAYPTRDAASGKLYVQGASDYRGTDRGFGGVGRLLTSQPEFETCSVRSAFRKFVGRDPATAERPALERLVHRFRHDRHDLRPILRSILTSDAYLAPVSF